MVLTKEINQKIVIAAILVSFGLIVGSIYLHIRQKHHFGRLNIGDSRVQPTAGVGISGNSKEYANDEAYTTMTHFSELDSGENLDEETSTDSYVVDNDYTNNYSIEYSNSNEDIQTTENEISSKCLQCLCKTVSDCRPVKCATVDPCGIYGISKFYWIDGGKQIANDSKTEYNEEEDDEHRDYLQCVNNDKCATDTVNAYLKRYNRDCNNNGIIECEDYIALHVLGPSGCANRELSIMHKIRMNSCLN
ncbi:uncharacterized protein LOC133332084 [Musca vetustissima]|uniref:uncharacterized protein LOC133332084 n=1 Tax=Musca vetustissima TaxID=27455 RepID=UPI002AB78147|nr:uncharacterized protein LOC133332084 [Musca vetustissima]